MLLYDEVLKKEQTLGLTYSLENLTWILLIRNVNTIFYTLEVCNKIIDFYLVDKKFVGKKWQNTVLKIDETFNLRNILTDET